MTAHRAYIGVYVRVFVTVHITPTQIRANFTSKWGRAELSTLCGITTGSRARYSCTAVAMVTETDSPRNRNAKLCATTEQKVYLV